MKLALIGFPISHSRSPELYRKFLGSELETYELLPFSEESALPTLDELSESYDGINITTPYKKSYFQSIKFDFPEIHELGAVNTILLKDKKFLATNTDFLAVEYFVKKHIEEYKNIFYIILGNGVMGKLTLLILQKLGLPFKIYSRSQDGDISKLDLSGFHNSKLQIIVINCCSRDFVFKGKLHSSFIFWDYNYSYKPHENSIPDKVRYYRDGFELLERQAIFAIEFWKKNS